MIPEILEHQADLEGLCRRFGVKRLDVFGSASTGAFRDGSSDLDFLVEFDSAPNVAGYVGRYFGHLESLDLLFARPVDLVVSAAITNPNFRESLNKTKERSLRLETNLIGAKLPTLHREVTDLLDE